MIVPISVFLALTIDEGVLDHLLAEVMIDPVDSILRPLVSDRRHHVATRFGMLSKRLLDHMIFYVQPSHSSMCVAARSLG